MMQQYLRIKADHPGTLVTTPTAAQMLVSSLINGSNSFKGTLDVRS